MNNGEIQLPVIDRRGFKRTVPMQVLCLGLSRSGTDSLCRALTILGIQTYHGFNVVYNHFELILWREAVESKHCNKGKIWGREDFDQILGDFGAVTDLPCAAFPVELIQAYPEAKVILNRRPFDKWYASYINAIQIPLVEDLWLRILPLFDAEARSVFGFWRWFTEGLLFRGSFRRNARLVYDEHTALVRGSAPKDRFLEWDVTQGWEPLCAFLDKPVPDMPFPSGNKAEELVRRINGEANGPRLVRALRNIQICAAVLVVCSSAAITQYVRPGLLGGVLGMLRRR